MLRELCKPLGVRPVDGIQVGELTGVRLDHLARLGVVPGIFEHEDLAVVGCRPHGAALCALSALGRDSSPAVGPSGQKHGSMPDGQPPTNVIPQELERISR